MRSRCKQCWGWEALESRLPLAGDVTVAISGGNLVITGDAESNIVFIWQDSTSGDWRVTGGRKVNGNASETTINGSLVPQSFSSATLDLLIDLGSQFDFLDISQAVVAGDTDIQLGDGKNDCTLTEGTIIDVSPDYELNDGTVPVRGDLEFNGDLSITTTGITSHIYIEVGASVDGDFSYQGGASTDFVRLMGTGTWNVTGDLFLDLGGGDNRFNEDPCDMAIGGSVTILSTENSNGLGGSFFGDAVIQGDLTITAGDGQFYVGLFNVQAADIVVSLGGDEDVIDSDGVTGDSVHFDLGPGNDRDSHFENYTIANEFVLVTGAGDDVAPLETITAASISVDMGGDNDACTAFDLVAPLVEFDMGIDVVLNVLGVYRVQATTLTIDTGNGAEGSGQYFGIVVGSCTITGTLSINSGGGLDNILLGSVVAANVQIDSGAQSDGVILLYCDLDSVTIETGGDLDIVGCHDSVFDDLDVLLGDTFDELWLGNLTVNTTTQLDGEADGGELHESGTNSLGGLTSNLTPFI